MPNLQVFDRINALNSPKLRSMPFDKYYGEMGLTKEQTEERISLAEDLEKDMLYFFYLMIAMAEYDTDMDVNEEMNSRVRDTIRKHTTISDRLDDHINTFVDDFERVTAEHLAVLVVLTDEVNKDIEAEQSSDSEEKTKEAKDREKKLESEQYWLSDDRARFVAEEEANTVFNDLDYEDALEAGYSRKTWNTMLDRYVRKTHRPMEGKTIPIDDYFLVGNSLMLYPRDPDGDPEEVIGCRCWLTYE